MGNEQSRAGAIADAVARFDDGRFRAELARRVGYRSESQDGGNREGLDRYLTEVMVPDLEALGFACTLHDNPTGHPGRFLIARRSEGADLPTVLTYGHGDVIRGYDEQWEPGLSPWQLVERAGRWYGRGTADNKGQHLINVEALKAVLATRGRLGCNLVMLLEMGEEAGSPGLAEFARRHAGALRADFLLASDGPRLEATRPTLFMGSRGVMNFDLVLELRDSGHHSGNWGGLLANPGLVLAHALASIVTKNGQIRVMGWRPRAVPAAIRAAVAPLGVGEGPDSPAIDPDWGEPGLSAGEKLFAWPSFEVLAFTCGNPGKPANAVPPKALAHCHLRFVPPLVPEQIVPALRAHLDERGFQAIRIEPKEAMAATRMLPDHPLVRWAAASIEATTGKAPAILPNLGGSLPNDVFAEILGLPTLWVPHSYAGCRQHAPNEHLLPELCREALAIMAGLWWDVGSGEVPLR
ncbi:MAG: M20 peptidase family dipeptidase [Geminicoccaceae bacterium]|nr:MAG: M20 peptidase family dipeptidase [Geminicoccaceae bacterium]